jgi:hypothetical protein
MITAEQVQSILRALSPCNIDMAGADIVKCEIRGVVVSIKTSDF